MFAYSLIMRVKAAIKIKCSDNDEVSRFVTLELQKCLIVALLLVTELAPGFAQMSNNQIEISAYGRFDIYPRFSYVFDGRPSNDFIRINGWSPGIAIGYKRLLSRHGAVKTAIGFYRYSFSNLKRSNTVFGESNTRNILYQSSYFINYHTDRYYYDCVTWEIAIQKSFDVRKKRRLVTTPTLTNYFALGQYYHLIRNPAGSQNFKTNHKRYFGTSLGVDLALIHDPSKNIVYPVLSVSVLDVWRRDAVFPDERNAQFRWKGFMGVGLGLRYLFNLR
jgi:hypothetical protein